MKVSCALLSLTGVNPIISVGKASGPDRSDTLRDFFARFLYHYYTYFCFYFMHQKKEWKLKIYKDSFTLY
jgi:hypothetical protein